MAPSRDPQPLEPKTSKAPKDPLAITTRLVIDGSNLLHTIATTPGAAPPAALIGRLRAAIPSRPSWLIRVAAALAMTTS